MTEAKTLDYSNLAEDILEQGAIVRLSLAGGSMFPLFRTGDSIFVKSVKPSEFHIGDIIVYRAGKKMIFHRLIKKYILQGKMILFTKGDFFTELDYPVSVKDVLGKAIGVERNGKKVNLENYFIRLANLFLAKISPFSKWFNPIPLLSNIRRRWI